MNLQVGTKLGDRYEVLRAITSGGMGSIYEGRDRQSGTRVAIKQMLEHLMEGEQAALFRSKFDAEVDFLRKLNHPGIPRLFDSFILQGVYYIVMEFIVGRNLDQELEERLQLTGQPFPVEQLIRDTRQVLDILDYLHTQTPPLLHRDIKPANLIREHPSGRIRLVDFGMARLLNDAGTQTQLGTLGYSPLEQLQGRAEQRSDLYALGATMHHLLTGVVPTVLNVPPALQLKPDLDPALAAIVDRACSTDLNIRFSNAQQMLRALDELRPHLPVTIDGSLKLEALPRIDEPSPASLPPLSPLLSTPVSAAPLDLGEPPLPPLRPRKPTEPAPAPLLDEATLEVEYPSRPPGQVSLSKWSAGRQLAVIAVLSALAFLIGWGVGHSPEPASPSPSPPLTVSASPAPASPSPAAPLPEISQTPVALTPSASPSPTETPTSSSVGEAQVSVALSSPAPQPARPKPAPKPRPRPAQEANESFSLDSPAYPTASRPSYSQGTIGLMNTNSRIQINLGSDWSSLGGSQQSRTFHRSFRKQSQGREFRFDVKGYTAEQSVQLYRNSFRADHRGWVPITDLPNTDLAFLNSQGRTHVVEALQAKLDHYYWYRFSGNGPGLDLASFRQEMEQAWAQVSLIE